MDNDRRGVTLVELLAVLSIVTVVTVTVFSFFFMNLANSRQAITKADLQTEATLIVTKLSQQVNEAQGDQFDIMVEGHSIKINKNKSTDDEPEWQTINTKNYDFSESQFNWVEDNAADAKMPNKLNVHLVIRSGDGSDSESFTLDTTLTYQWREETDGAEEEK